MFRFFSRALGLWVVAGAFVAAVIDGMKSIAASTLIVTSTLAAWGDLAPSTLGATRALIEGRIGAGVWHTATATLLALPTWAVLGVIGAGLIALGRPKPAPVGVVP